MATEITHEHSRRDVMLKQLKFIGTAAVATTGLVFGDGQVHTAQALVSILEVKVFIL